MGQVIGIFIVFIVRFFYILLVYSPILLLSGYLTMKLDFLYSELIEISVFVFLLIAYLIYCLVFFIKGISISLKVNKNRLWILIMVLSVILVVGIPVLISYIFIFKFMVDDLDKPDSLQIKLWSLVFSLVIGVLVYKKYEFHKDICPKLPFWAYDIGFNLGLKFVKNPVDEDPDQGKQIF